MLFAVVFIVVAVGVVRCCFNLKATAARLGRAAAAGGARPVVDGTRPVAVVVVDAADGAWPVVDGRLSPQAS